MKLSTIVFLSSFVLLSFSACKTSKNIENANNTTNLVGTKWKLTELYGKPVADKINGKEPFLELLETDSQYTATAGCNGIGGTFSILKNGKIKFSQGMSTMMACENMDVEIQLKKALTLADNYSVSDNTLSLNKSRMAPLARFKAIEK